MVTFTSGYSASSFAIIERSRPPPMPDMPDMLFPPMSGSDSRGPRGVPFGPCSRSPIWPSMPSSRSPARDLGRSPGSVDAARLEPVIVLLSTGLGLHPPAGRTSAGAQPATVPVQSLHSVAHQL